MEAMTVLTSGSGPYTRAERDALPEDGRRHELLDGVLIVTPSPQHLHQRAVTRLWRLLDDACPEDQEVLVAPFDVTLSEDTVLQPDVLVARRSDITQRHLSGAPVLAIEVLSPSTRRYDLLLKRSRYEHAGCPAYWVVDPDETRLIAWELVDGSYVEVANLRRQEQWTATVPYPVTVRPADLVA